MRLSVLPRVRGHSRARAAAFTGALLGLLATSPLLQPLPAAATSLNVALVSSAEWREHLDGFTMLHLVGEVANNDASDAGVIQVTYNLYDSPTHIRGSEAFLTSDASGADILAHGEATSYNDALPLPAWYDHSAVASVTAAVSQTPPEHNFSITQKACSDANDASHVCGTVSNLNPVAVDQVRVILTFTTTSDPSSAFVDGDGMSLQNNETSSLAAMGTAGDSADFELVRSPDAPVWGGVTFLAESTTTPPAPPDNVAAIASPNQATVSWAAPDNGGSPLTGYTVTTSPADVPPTTVGANQTSTTINGLTNCTSYTFTVTESNGLGAGHPSVPSTPVTPLDVPGKPTGVTAQPGTQTATVSWSAPGSDGGAPITSYTVTSSPEGKTTTTADGTTLSATVIGLSGGKNYSFTVMATNAVGNSAESDASAAVFVPGPPSTPLPGPPGNVSGSAGSGYATVNWSAPVANGANAITGYRITASPGGRAMNAAAGARSIIFGGLANNTYTFSVQAVNGDGNGQAASTNAVTVVNGGGQYHPVAPFRLLDTRNDNRPIVEGENRVVQITGQGGLPDNIAAVVLNVTATQPTGPSFLTIYPSDVIAMPTASNLNFAPGQTIPNLVVATIGAGGRVTVFNHIGSVHVLFDVEGWISTPQTTAGTAGLFRPLTPARLMDTRTGHGGSGRLQAGQTVNLQVAGVGEVPGTGLSAVVLNVTAVSPTANGYVSVLPGGPALSQPPATSSVNFSPGQTIPNRVVVPVSAADRQISIYNHAGSVDVVVDVSGWYTDGTDPSAILGQFNAMAPTRIVDTRDSQNDAAHAGALGQGQSFVLPVTGAGRCSAGSSGAVMNVTVTDTTGSSFLRVYPSDANPVPFTSDLNWTAGTTIPNLVVVRLRAADGVVTIYNNVGSTSVVADLSGCFN